MKVLTVAPPGSAEWISAHAGKLGAHDIASIVGVGRETPLQVWARVTGKVPREDISRKSYVRRGVALEEAVARLYSEESGRLVFEGPGLIQHPSIDWIATTPDRTVRFQDETHPELGVPGLLECKTAQFFKAREWLEGIPLATQVQLQTQLACCGYKIGSAACLPVDADEDAAPVLWADLPFDAVLVDRILDRLTQFRDKHWLTDIPPPPTAKDAGVVADIFPRHVEGEVRQMSEKMDVRWRTRKQILEAMKPMQAEADTIAAEARLECGTAEWLQGPGYVLRWQTNVRKAYTVPAGEVRTLREMKGVK